MLTDVAVEEGFDLRGEDLWYSKQDLENDLHLAAELGKTLLARNHELEQTLQQMYNNNQEQLQEIEYLTKQMEVLRQMNEQHAKVYEQLDGVARELELGNSKLVQDNRAAQQRIHSLTETVDSLQAHMDELQEQVEQLSEAQSERSRREQAQLQLQQQQLHRRTSLGTQSVPCLRELLDMQADGCLTGVDVIESEQECMSSRGEGEEEEQRATVAQEEEEEEREALLALVGTLEAQLEAERVRRHEAEQEAEATVEENSLLSQRLTMLESHRSRQAELELEVEELRLLWRAEVASSRRARRGLPDDDVFVGPDEQPEEEECEEEEDDEEKDDYPLEVKEEGMPRPRCQSESALQGISGAELRRRHRPTCARRPRALWCRGVSLLSEVDAQYSALQRQYDELLRRCQLAGAAGVNSHKAVQTAVGCPAHCISHTSKHTRAHVEAHAAAHAVPSRRLSTSSSGEPPEYKALFLEIFHCIQKTKGDLSDSSIQAIHKLQMSQPRRLSQPSQLDGIQ